jgi:hypothetical protein
MTFERNCTLICLFSSQHIMSIRQVSTILDAFSIFLGRYYIAIEICVDPYFAKNRLAHIFKYIMLANLLLVNACIVVVRNYFLIFIN